MSQYGSMVMYGTEIDSEKPNVKAAKMPEEVEALPVWPTHHSPTMLFYRTDKGSNELVSAERFWKEYYFLPNARRNTCGCQAEIFWPSVKERDCYR